MNKSTHTGFTIIEILVAIVVIAVLSTITAVLYTNAQVQARDLKVRDAADKFADSVMLFASKNGRLPRGGSNSTAAIGGDLECADGVNGWALTGGYLCTVEDTLVASEYLPPGFSSKLPQNTLYAASPSKRSIMFYTYGTDMAMVYYSQESPTTAETANFNAEMTRCGINPAGTVGPRDSSGMDGGICIQFK